MKSSGFVVAIILVLISSRSQPSDSITENSVSDYSGKIEQSYISPVRIVWQSENAEIINPERLLKEGLQQASLINDDVCILKNGKEKASVLLDFGKELHGGLLLVTGMPASHKPVEVRIRFGESVSEAMANTGGETNATNDHAIRDWQVKLPWLGKLRIGDTGFRFVRIDLLNDDAELQLKEVSAISVMRDIPYLGSFKSNNDRLNKIWETGAYTVHLNMQEYLWDGIKRDRLVWVGDMHPEVMTILSVFGDNEVIPKSLDFIAGITPPDQWMNGISSYSMWWLLIQHEYYMYTGDIEYLKKYRNYIFDLLAKLETKIQDDGSENLDGNRFLDWPTSQDSEAIHAGLQSMMVMSFKAGTEMAEILGDKEKSAHYTSVVEKLKSYELDLPGRKSPGALMALAGIMDAESVNEELLVKDGVKDISTFYGYYVLNAMASAGNYQGAMDFISEYWGGMLDLGATSFWEDFNILWKENAGRIDEIVPEGKIDIHATYGDYCYVKHRHSLCHGWASGPTAWLSHYVLGVEIMEPGCKTIKISPNLGTLEWVEGSYPTPMGTIRIRHEKTENGEIVSDITAPDGIKILQD